VYQRCTEEIPDKRPSKLLDIVFELERLHDDDMLEGKLEFSDFFEFEEQLSKRRSSQWEQNAQGVASSWLRPDQNWST
jgi:hypothetical protein